MRERDRAHEGEPIRVRYHHFLGVGIGWAERQMTDLLMISFWRMFTIAISMRGRQLLIQRYDPIAATLALCAPLLFCDSRKTPNDQTYIAEAKRREAKDIGIPWPKPA